MNEQGYTSDTPSRGRFQRRVIDADISPGLTLSTARTEARQTLAFYARRLSIPERYLRALEQEDVTDLPGLVYEKHFVARYAEALKLDSEMLVARWVALRETEAKSLTRFVPRVQRWNLWVSPQLGRRLVMAAIFLAVTGFVSSRAVVLLEAPALELRTPYDEQVVATSRVLVEGRAAAGATVTVNDAQVTTTDGAFSVPMTLDRGINTIRVVAERRFGRQAIVERRVFVPEPGDAVSLSGSLRDSVLR